MLKDLAFITLMLILVLSLTYLTYLGGLGELPPSDVRLIAKNYLNLTYNTYFKGLWASSPEAVTAIVWDYRGLDTLFETVVFYGAVLSAITLFRRVARERDLISSKGMSVIVKRTTAIVVVAILTVAFSTALHGHLTPGGGFQAGAIGAVAPLVMIVVFGKKYLEDRGLSYEKLLSLRNIALTSIGLTSVALFIYALIQGGFGFIFQNQGKPLSQYSFPPYVLDVPSGGTLLFFNVFEFLAVLTGFTLVFLILLGSEELLSKEFEGGENGY